MKQMVAHLLEKIEADGFEWAFAKVHKDNFASQKSLTNNNFKIFSSFKKPVKMDEFCSLSEKPFFSEIGKQNAQKTLAKYPKDATEIVVDYNIIVKKL